VGGGVFRGCRTQLGLAPRGLYCQAARLSQDGGYGDGWVRAELGIAAAGNARLRGSAEERRTLGLGAGRTGSALGNG